MPAKQKLYKFGNTVITKTVATLKKVITSIGNVDGTLDSLHAQLWDMGLRWSDMVSSKGKWEKVATSTPESLKQIDEWILATMHPAKQEMVAMDSKDTRLEKTDKADVDLCKFTTMNRRQAMQDIGSKRSKAGVYLIAREIAECGTGKKTKAVIAYQKDRAEKATAKEAKAKERTATHNRMLAEFTTDTLTTLVKKFEQHIAETGEGDDEVDHRGYPLPVLERGLKALVHIREDMIKDLKISK